ncbi:hypothetical protein ACFVWY_34240 [Streptomyces sp. NPDC058195]|uniref:hypothetical protein n=1 Tax=Streptomyces sp. NPDC058195 TaxID=3346375 RepID=UPI0036EE944C
MVAGPVAFGCRLCAAGQWLPEAVAAQRRWVSVARRAVRAGADPERVFALAQAVVARWWEQALGWERETIWPGRLHQVAGGGAGGDLERWRIVGRDAVVFPEVVAVADALLDPARAELVWMDSGAARPRALSADGLCCRKLGERLGRGWLGPRAATDHGGPLIAWMGRFLPSSGTAERPRSDDRVVPNGSVRMLRTGSAWRDVPERGRPPVLDRTASRVRKVVERGFTGQSSGGPGQPLPQDPLDLILGDDA